MQEKTVAEFRAEQEARIAAHSTRILLGEQRRGIKRIPRGRRREVVRSDGQVYRSVSDAAIANGVNKPDNICQAIRRGGKCEGWHWAYKGQEPKGFYGSTSYSLGIQFTFVAPDMLIPLPHERNRLPRRHHLDTPIELLPWPDLPPDGKVVLLRFNGKIKSCELSHGRAA